MRLTSATRQVRQQWFSVGIFPLKLLFGLTGNRPQSAPACSFLRYQQGEEKDSDTENDRENGLRMKNEMTMKEKRFSFFAHPQERKAESRPTFGTLPFAQHTSQRFAKVKEPNLSDTQINFNNNQ